MPYGNKYQINQSHGLRGDAPDEELDDTCPSSKEPNVSSAEVDTWGAGDWDEQDIDLR